MANAASKNKKLMLQEMSLRELQVHSRSFVNPTKNATFMFFSYIFGGLTPLFAYFFLPIYPAIYFSIGITLAGLFLLGAATTKYTKISWVRAGFRVMLFGSFALLSGYIIGKLVGLVRG